MGADSVADVGDLLDLILVCAVVLFGITGYRQGFLVGVLSFAGFLGGGVLGVFVAPPIAEQVATGGARSLIGIALVLALASVGQLLGAIAGGALRRRMVWKQVRLVDSIGGSVMSAVGVLLVAWVLGTAVQDSPYRGLSKQVRGSVILQTVDDVMPSAPTFFDAFRRMIDERGFPQVFVGLGPRDTASVPPPDPAVLNSPAVRTARSRVLKIVGIAPSCRRRLEGSGFVYAPEHVMTNAHVVAGTREVTVEGENGRKRDGRVVLYDPRRDIAVIYVPGLGLAPLVFAGDADSGDSAVVAGYPENGPFNAGPARVRERITAVGRDIYQRNTVRRDVYALRAVVRQGNSGGPLLAPDGRVYGMIFAAAADDANTGYALTADEVAPDATGARSRTTAVSTQSCD